MSEVRNRSPFVPTLVAWLVPGAGHLTIGRPWPGIFVAGSILTLFAGGFVLGGFENVSWERHPWLFGLQGLTGLPAGITSLATRGVKPGWDTHRTVGDLFTCVAGLLNLVAVADVWARCTHGDPEERLARHHAAEDAAAAPPRAEDLVARDDASPSAVAPEGPGRVAAPPATPTASRLGGPDAPEAPRG